jgi:hypothetical protein
MQTRRNSIKEALLNMVIGYAVYVFALFYITPDASLLQNLKVGAILRIISLITHYCIRRWFNHTEHKDAA